MDFLIHWPPGPVVATVQCQGLINYIFLFAMFSRSLKPLCSAAVTMQGLADRSLRHILLYIYHLCDHCCRRFGVPSLFLSPFQLVAVMTGTPLTR